MGKIFIVDQNYLRDPNLSALAQQPNTKFIIPEASFFEMCKGSKWEGTIRSSLKILSRHPNKVFLTYPYKDLEKKEFSAREPIKNIISTEYTEYLRGLLSEINSNTSGKSIARLENLISTQQEADLADLNVRGKKALIALVSLIRSQLPNRLFLDIKNQRIPYAEMVRELRRQLPNAINSYYANQGATKELRDSIIRKNPAFVRRSFLLILIGMDWIMKNGLENLAEHKVTNQLVDNEYIMAASYFPGSTLLTKEAYMRTLLQNLKLGLKLP